MSRGSSRSKVVVGAGQARVISRASVVLPIWRGPRIATTGLVRSKALISCSSVARPNTRERYHEILSILTSISWCQGPRNGQAGARRRGPELKTTLQGRHRPRRLRAAGLTRTVGRAHPAAAHQSDLLSRGARPARRVAGGRGELRGCGGGRARAGRGRLRRSQRERRPEWDGRPRRARSRRARTPSRLDVGAVEAAGVRCRSDAQSWVARRFEARRRDGAAAPRPEALPVGRRRAGPVALPSRPLT